MIEQRRGTLQFFDDFGGCEESTTFQNKGNPQERRSIARISHDFRVGGELRKPQGGGKESPGRQK